MQNAKLRNAGRNLIGCTTLSDLFLKSVLPPFLFRHGFAAPPSPRGKVFGGSELPTCGFYIVGGADSFILHFSLENTNSGREAGSLPDVLRDCGYVLT